MIECPECGRECRTEQTLAMHRQTHGVPTGWAKPSRARAEEGKHFAEPADEEPTLPGMDEAPIDTPKEPKHRRKIVERMWGHKEEPAGGLEGVPQRPTKERAPARPVRRMDSSDFFERVWAAAGRRIERNVGDVPLGRCLQLTSGATGVILDDAVKGTVADKPVQWLVRTEDKMSKVVAVLAAPVLVATMERNPAAAETLAPFLIDALMAMGPAMVKSLEKAERRQADFAKAMAGLGPALGLAPDEQVTPDLLLAWMFPPPPPPDERAQPGREAAA